MPVQGYFDSGRYGVKPIYFEIVFENKLRNWGGRGGKRWMCAKYCEPIRWLMQKGGKRVWVLEFQINFHGH